MASRQVDRDRASSTRSWFLVAVAGSVVMAAALAIAMSVSGSRAGRVALTVAAVEGQPLPPLPGGGSPDGAVGMTQPAIEGLSFTGEPVSIGDDGRAKAIVFLAHWCPHCRAEVPTVQTWLDGTGPPADVDLYSVVTSSDPARPNYPPDEWLQQEGWTMPVLVDGDNRAAGVYGLTGFPYWVFIDREGTIAGRWSGELSIADLERALEVLAAASGPDA